MEDREEDILYIIYKVMVKQDVELKSDYGGLFRKGVLKKGVYTKRFTFYEKRKGVGIKKIQDDFRGIVTAKHTGVIDPDDY